MDFYPLAGKCQGAPLDLSSFDTDTDFTLDFNGMSKVAAKGATVYRGAYAGEASNPGWSLSASVKAPAPPAPKRGVTVVWLTPSGAEPGSIVQLAVTGADFAPASTLAAAGAGVQISDVKVESSSRITATLKIAAGAAAGVRGITVSTPSGTSNPANFRINARKPKI
jgi:hypothetical protein